MTRSPVAASASLLVRERACVYALPLPHVVETLRPLPVEPVSGMPFFVEGLSVIRGRPVPVIGLGSLLGGKNRAPSTRWVTLRTGAASVALAVEEVLGVDRLGEVALQEMPPLLREASAEIVTAIGVLDERLLVVLRATRILPEEIGRRLSAGEARP